MEIAIVPQLPIGKYRADFAIAVRKYDRTWFVLVECDGAMFHYGVEDVKSDLDRDVWIMRQRRVLGMIRLDAKDIFRRPEDAARRVENAVCWAWSKGNEEAAKKITG
jgi:very-short-patch-repair endonuclease